MFFIKTEEEKEIDQIEFNRIAREDLEDMEIRDRLRSAFWPASRYTFKLSKPVNEDSENQTE